MQDWLTKITDWIVELVKALLSWIPEIVGDCVVLVLKPILGVLADLITSLPVPSFMNSGTFGGILGGLPPFALYVINQMSFGAAFSMIAAGVSFNLLRKLFTLGQW